MKLVWISFIVGLFIGANIGLVVLAIFFSGKSYDHYLPDIEDVQAEK